MTGADRTTEDGHDNGDGRRIERRRERQRRRQKDREGEWKERRRGRVDEKDCLEVWTTTLFPR